MLVPLVTLPRRRAVRRIGPMLLASALGLAGPAEAREPARTQAAALLAAPERHVGRPVRLDGIDCVDTGGAGFVCTAERAERILSLSASAIGRRTRPEIAERLLKTCRGADNLKAASCRFGVAMRPSSFARGAVSAGGVRRPLVTFYASEIDLF